MDCWTGLNKDDWKTEKKKNEWIHNRMQAQVACVSYKEGKGGGESKRDAIIS